MTDLLQRLPELPSGIKMLSSEESQRLNAQYPGISSPKDCVTCGGKGTFLGLTTEGTVADFECNCNDQWILHRYLLHSGVGTAYQRLGWHHASSIEPAAMLAVGSWLDASEESVRAGIGLLMSGNRGTGKTLLAILMLKRLLAEGHDGYFTTFSGLIDMLMASWRTPEEARWYHARCRNSGILVIDDVGREVHQRRMVTGEGMKDYATASSEFAIESVLRHRIAMAKPTIITTNLTVDGLRQHYGDHLKSLLTESAQLYAFTGQDYRPEARSSLLDEGARGIVRPVVVG